MSLIATVNGTSVYSNKTMTSLVNTRINFADGSWCDVKTGKIHNNGPGYISIGDQEVTRSNTKTITKGPEQVAAASLWVGEIDAVVHVTVHDRKGVIEYSMTGPADQLDAVCASMSGDLLVIKGSRANASRGGVSVNNVSIRGSANIVVGGNRFGSFSGKRAARSNVTLDIAVPKGTPVTIDNVSGNTIIGDTHGPLVVNVQQGDVDAGQVTSAQLAVQGSGDIRVAKTFDSIMGILQGNGRITIEESVNSALLATVQGNGDVRVGGSVSRAILAVQGNGTVHIAHSKMPPQKIIAGSGSVKVSRVG